MTTSESIALRAEVLPLDLDSLLPLLRESYGPAYFGDERIGRVFNNVTRVIGLVDDLGAIAAASMIEQTRIIASATSTDIQRFGSRRDLMINLKTSCREDGHAYWATIGQHHTKMMEASMAAGMERFTDVSLLQNILKESRQGHQYDIVSDHQDLPIFVTNTGAGTGNRQQIWGWTDRLPTNTQSL